MKQTRLRWLLGLLTTLLVLRWLLPSTPLTESVPVSPAVVRPAVPASAVDPGAPEASPFTTAQTRQTEPDHPQDAFAVRTPQLPITVPVAVRAPAVVEMAAPPPVTAPPPAPPLQVIGTWSDGGDPAVFVATPQGTRLVRAGEVLLAEYRVSEVSASHLLLVHTGTDREVRLTVPTAAGR